MRERFEKPIDRDMMRLIASIPLDRRLYREDIEGSIAHAEALLKAGILTEDEFKTLREALVKIKEDIEEGRVELKEEFEDIHMNIENILKERVGDVALKLHTGRSRNDQIALDMRLFLKRKVPELIEGIKNIQRSILRLAERYKDVIMPGYTHLQRAQPVLFSHWIMAYFWMLKRDTERLKDSLKRIDVMPLGSGAFAGISFPLDRELIRERLGFSEISENSVDAVSDRDFILEVLFALSVFFLHISRLMEEIILWCSSEFDFAELDDEFVSFSSIMPQKRNPDGAELVRAKSGRVFSDLFHLLVVMKGLPLSYNRDFQEDKAALFDALDTFDLAVSFLPRMIETMKIKRERMEKACEFSLLATDLVDYLVRKGVPFREAHSLISRLMKETGGRKPTLSELKRFSDKFEEDILEMSPGLSVELKDIDGGTSPRRVEEEIKKGWRFLNED